MNVLDNKQQRGVALLEVLIAIFVIAFGFLALLKLQMTSLNNVTAANQRYVAANIGQAMVERLRAASTPTDYRGKKTADFTKNCDSATCTVVEQDIFEWKRDLSDARDALPGGKGEIAQDALTQRFFITMTWNEKLSQGDVEEVAFVLEVSVL